MLVASWLENDHFSAQARSRARPITHSSQYSLPETTAKSKSPTITVLEALLSDIDLYDRVYAGDATVPASETQTSIEARLDLAIPVLIHAGVFEVVKPDHWLLGDSMGRKFVGISAKLLGR